MNLKTNIMENTNNSKPYNQVTEDLWEFMRRLSVSNECPQFNIDNCRKSLQQKLNISNDVFDHAYEVLKDTGTFKEIKRENNVVTFKLLK